MILTKFNNSIEIILCIKTTNVESFGSSVLETITLRGWFDMSGVGKLWGAILYGKTYHVIFRDHDIRGNNEKKN